MSKRGEERWWVTASIRGSGGGGIEKDDREGCVIFDGLVPEKMDREREQ